MKKNNLKKHQLRQLIKMAFITSPIIGIYTVTPMVLFIISLPNSETIQLFWDKALFAVAVGLVTLFVFIQWLIDILLFSVLDNRLKKNIPKALKYFLSYTIFIGFVAVTQHARKHIDPISTMDIGLFEYYPFIGAVGNNTFILIIFSLVTTKHQRAQLEIDKTKLELAQYVTQQEQLKNKIHPHFIFNALNTLKLLIKKNQKTAEEYLVRLSSYLRFSITETAKDTALIKDELEFCVNYIELQKVRFNDSIIFENSLREQTINNEYLPVVTLQSLAENAIKHNAFSQSTPLHIQLYQNKDNSITFSNNLIPKRTDIASTGTGLKNLRERFKLLKCRDISIEKDIENELFKVTFNTIKK